MLPILLHPYQEHLIKSWRGVYISEKYDGWRMTWNYKSQCFMSRTGKILSVPTYLYDEIKKLGEYNFDGEYWGGYSQISKISGEEPCNDDDKDYKDMDNSLSSSDNMYFKIFDIIDTSMNFEKRLHILKQINSTTHIEICKHIFIPINSKNVNNTLIKNALDNVILKGGEGIVLRNPDGMYVNGIRSYDILKLKPVDYTELLVMAYHVTNDAMLKRDDKYVSSLICYTEDGNDLRVTWGNRKAELPKIHSIIRIKYSQLTLSNVPKFPSYIGIVSERDIDTQKLEKFNCYKQQQKQQQQRDMNVDMEMEEIMQMEMNRSSRIMNPIENENNHNGFTINKTIVLVSSYYTTKYSKLKENYVSTLMTYTIDGLLTYVVVKTFNPPEIGKLILISYKSLTKTGAPKNAKIINEEFDISPDDKLRFDDLRAFEGLIIKCSSKRNTYSLTDNQVQLLKTNNKFIGLFNFQQALMSKPSIPAGKFALVQNGNNIYKVCCSVKGNNIYCSCPSWIYQPLPPIKRVCKHCTAFNF